jgi:hypothetical protein
MLPMQPCNAPCSTRAEICVQSAENGIGTARRSHVWDGVACEPEDKETSDDEGSEASLKSEIVALEKRDFDDKGGDHQRRCRG